jgi:hypothetical protein
MLGAEDAGAGAVAADFASAAGRDGFEDMTYYPKRGKGDVKHGQKIAETARENRPRRRANSMLQPYGVRFAILNEIS